MPDVPGSSESRGQALAQISTGLVQLHARHYGRGPTKAKTHMVGDVVVTTLRGGITPVERTLVDTGEMETVYRLRRSFQQAMDGEFKALVEEALGRTVIAHMSNVHYDPDLAIELFILEPVAGSEDMDIGDDDDLRRDGGPPEAD